MKAMTLIWKGSRLLLLFSVMLVLASGCVDVMPSTSPSAAPEADGRITVDSVQIGGARITISGQSTLGDGSCLQTQLFADGEPESWWPGDTCVAVEGGRWEAVARLGEGAAPAELDPNVEYEFRIWQQDNPQVEALFFLDLEGPPGAPSPTSGSASPETPSVTPVPTEAASATSTPSEVTPTATPVADAAEVYEDRGDPVRLLASYYNAVNRGEYERAWSYWESPPSASYEDFAEGYAETASVLLAVSPPTRVEGAAGSVYAAVPTLLVSTHMDGSQHAFVGCYVARRTNPGVLEGSTDTDWWLYSATITATPGNTTDATLLADACESQEATGPDQPLYDDRGDPVALLASYYNALNRAEYERAYSYWESPPGNVSYEEFAEGYADTESVLLVVSPPTRYEGAAGSVYVSIPTLLVATHLDGSQHAFVGCFVARRANVGVEGATAEWSLYDARVASTPGNTRDVTLLREACATW